MLRIEIMSRPQVCLLRVTDVNEAAVDLVLMQPFSTLFATLHFHNTPYLPPKVLHKHCFQFLLGFTRGNIISLRKQTFLLTKHPQRRGVRKRLFSQAYNVQTWTRFCGTPIEKWVKKQDKVKFF